MNQSSNTVLVTVSDDRQGRKNGIYRQTQYLIARLLNEHLQLVQWDFDKLRETDFYKTEHILLDNTDSARNGRAYKPYVIYEALRAAEPGALVVYNDCSPELWDENAQAFIAENIANIDFGILRRLTEDNGGVLSCFVKWDEEPVFTHGLGQHTHRNFTTTRCLRRMSMEKHEHDFQHASGMMAFINNADTQDFVREWLYWNCNPECSALGWANIPNDYSFWTEDLGLKLGHRHDQSISGLLLNRRGANLIDLPQPLANFNPYNFLQYCLPNVHYQYINSINRNPPAPTDILRGSWVRNEADELLRVFAVDRRFPERIRYRVGAHAESTYTTTAQFIKLVQQ